MPYFIERLLRWLRFQLMYFGSPPWDTGITPPELYQFIQEHSPGEALDLGCGTGTNLVALAKAGWQVTGVDFIQYAVSAARRRLAKESLPGEVRLGDVTSLEITRGSYHLVLDIGCYHSLTIAGREAYRTNLKEILLPGGWFLMYAHWAEIEQQAGVGISADDLSGFLEILELENRQDSLDRWGHQASWMTFRKR